MPRLYRPTGMRKYRPFGGAGGELLSVSGGGGAAFSDNFESYTAGELTAQSNWAAGRGNATATVVSGNYVSVVVNVDGLCSFHWDDVGSQTDGLAQSEVVVSSSGHANCQPGLIARYLDDNNFVWCALNNGFNNLTVGSLIAGVQSADTVAATWTRGQTYYVDFELSSGSATCRVYTDADRTTLYHQKTLSTGVYTGAGKWGVQNNAQATGQGNFDNWSFTS